MENPSVTATEFAASSGAREVEAPSPRGVEAIDEELLVEEISIDGMCGVY